MYKKYIENGKSFPYTANRVAPVMGLSQANHSNKINSSFVKERVESLHGV